MAETNTVNWQPYIRVIIERIDSKIKEKFSSCFTPNRPFLIEKNIDEAFVCYSKNMLPFIRQEMDMENEDELIDRYKIIAGYIFAFFKYPPFDTSILQEDTLHILKMINEYFLITLIKQILLADWKKEKNINIEEIHLPNKRYTDADKSTTNNKNYIDYIVSLLRYIKNKCERPSIFILSELIFYIEMSSHCIFNGCKRFYFKDDKDKSY